jgi:Protein of unknown function (DUF3306)
MASKNRKDIKTARAEPQESVATQEGFLRRWSERKARVRAREKVPASSEPPVSEVPPPAQANTPAQSLTDADMPPIDTLDEKSDYKGFLSPEVSENLRRLALRKLFHLPAFNVRDGLDDYDEDFRTFEPLGNIVTAHERHQLELKQQEDQERLAQEKAAEKPAVSASDAEAAEGSSKGEQPADETASAEPEDAKDLEEDSDSPRHG